MTLRRADSDKEDDFTVATCLEHAGDALTKFTWDATTTRIALVQAVWLSPGAYDPCGCGAPAAFVLVHVLDDVPGVPPTVPATVERGRRDAECVGTHDKKHRDVCVACGMTPGGVHGL